MVIRTLLLSHLLIHSQSITLNQVLPHSRTMDHLITHKLNLTFLSSNVAHGIKHSRLPNHTQVLTHKPTFLHSNLLIDTRLLKLNRVLTCAPVVSRGTLLLTMERALRDNRVPQSTIQQTHTCSSSPSKPIKILSRGTNFGFHVRQDERAPRKLNRDIEYARYE